MCRALLDGRMDEREVGNGVNKGLVRRSDQRREQCSMNNSVKLPVC